MKAVKKTLVHTIVNYAVDGFIGDVKIGPGLSKKILKATAMLVRNV